MLQAFPGTLGRARMGSQRSNVTFSTTSVTAGGTIGTYGASWTQAIASTAFDATMLRIYNVATLANSAARSDYAVTIAVGGAGVERQVIGPLLFGAYAPYSSYTLPIFIPSASRISLKAAAGVASRAITFSLDYMGAPNAHYGGLPTQWVAYGTTVSSGNGAYGTAITGGSTNTWSAWTALTTSTTYGHDLWLPMCASGSQTVITAVNYRTQFAIANTTDAATMVTNNTGVWEGPWLTGSTGEQLGAYPTVTNPVILGTENIIYAPRAANSSVSARVMCSGTATTTTTNCAILAAVK
jgi:hypothetical protein